MGIKFRCQGCNKKLHVKTFLAGKRGVCPQCGAKIRIPLASEEPETSGAVTGKQEQRQNKAVATKKTQAAKKTSTAPMASSSSAIATPERESVLPSNAPGTTRSAAIKDDVASDRVDKGDSPTGPQAADPITEAPEAVWYVRPPTGGQYGPADGATMRRWLDEGRVSADSLVWREGWDDWKMGDTIFPSLRAAPAPIASPAASDGLSSTSLEGVPQDEFAFGDSAAGPRPAKKRKSRARNIAIVVTLSVVCVGLLVALLLVLKNHG